ncbi:hypothetical protein [Aliikangiella coralliicola]|uniref:Nucleotidyltransferase domain-containing protein n=1 Tax=Aliikangiella coralliicola TaxID=2592383 RepID=A0A545UE33_9GAMM|nr:hypothetical protein [Aliikangiella coralliicola]TQV87693.1 hypothetical protein FLL46_09920 [Aliikangiella coralliicola]
MFGLGKFFRKKSKNISLQFEAALGENLHALIQYGSSVKGSARRDSDVNLLVVLNLSTPEAHSAIHEIILENPDIEPFTLGIRGFDRTVSSFAVKFLSISRHYKVLSGHDVLSRLNISLEHERFLAEQALRNLRLKIVHCFVKKGATKAYLRFVLSLTTSIIIDISEVLRCNELEVPVKHSERVDVFAKHFEFDVFVLKTLITYKESSYSLTQSEIENLHRNLFILLDNILLYIESNWHE